MLEWKPQLPAPQSEPDTQTAEPVAEQSVIPQPPLPPAPKDKEPRGKKPRGRVYAYQLFAFLPVILIIAFALTLGLRRHTDHETVKLSDKATESLSAKVVLSCLSQAYPELVSSVDFESEENEWTVTISGTVFAWAHGRMLPLSERDAWESYRPIYDYIYPWEILSPDDMTAEMIQRFKELPNTQGKAPPPHLGFVDALYGGSTQDAVWEMQEKTRFLGRQITVHKMVVEPLSRVEAVILQAANYSPEVRKFLKNVYSVGGYNWRPIKGQKSLSYHSFGIAVDILPKNFDELNVYWQWVMENDDDWAILPLDERWSPPREVVQAFEDNGFIWGGKWTMYDNMHFEYRPEMILMRERYLPAYLYRKK